MIVGCVEAKSDDQGQDDGNPDARADDPSHISTEAALSGVAGDHRWLTRVKRGV